MAGREHALDGVSSSFIGCELEFCGVLCRHIHLAVVDDVIRLYNLCGLQIFCSNDSRSWGLAVVQCCEGRSERGTSDRVCVVQRDGQQLPRKA
jgi:hypothetical protein